jgi:predicted Zn-dependent protease
LGLALLSAGALVPGPLQAADVGQALEKEYGVVGTDTSEGRAMNAQLDRVVDRIAPAAGMRPKSATILGPGSHGQHQGEINAMALPDGRIYVMSGLMSAIRGDRDSDAELAFVVGHEITHVTGKHAKRQNSKNMVNSIGALILQGVTKGSSIVRTGTDLYVNAMAGHYSRKDEYAADKGAVLAMRRAGYPPEAGADMLDKIERKYGSGSGGIVTWFNSHPPTKNRIATVRRLARGA